MSGAKIPLQDVHSSTIKAVGYDPDAQRLAVQFHSGGTYHYEGVAPEAHAGLMGAESIGKHFHTFVRGQYPHARVDDQGL